MQQIMLLLAIGLLVTACGLIDQLAQLLGISPQPTPAITPSPPPANVTITQANATPPNGTQQVIIPPPAPLNTTPSNATPPDGTSVDLQVWNGINTLSVEQVCLAEAKAEAGGFASAVHGCTCVETAGNGVKSYACGISTIQGTIAAQISCTLATTTCSYSSSYGSGNVTFDQIRQAYGQTGG